MRRHYIHTVILLFCRMGPSERNHVEIHPSCIAHQHTALLTLSGIELLSDKRTCVGQDESPLILSP